MKMRWETSELHRSVRTELQNTNKKNQELTESQVTFAKDVMKVSVIQPQGNIAEGALPIGVV